MTSCGYDDARRHRVRGAGFVSCVSSQCSPCWCCSRGRRSHSVWFAPSRARSLNSTPQPSTPRSTASSTPRTAAPCSPCSAATRAACSSRTSTTSRRSCARRSCRSRIAGSTSTTASTRAASCARSCEDVRSQGVVEGGSTITQQFVKNAYVRNQKTIARKVREAALAWQLEQALAQGPDPARVPQHDLLRQRRLRDPAGVADVLRQGRRPPDAARGSAARRAARRPVALRPDAASSRGHAATPLRAADDVRPGEDHHASSSASPRARRCRSPRTSTSPAPAGTRASTSSTTSTTS